MEVLPLTTKKLAALKASNDDGKTLQWKQLLETFQQVGTNDMEALLDSAPRKELSESASPQDVCNEDILKLREVIAKKDDLHYLCIVSATSVLKRRYGDANTRVGRKRKRIEDGDSFLINLLGLFYGLHLPELSAVSLQYKELMEERAEVEKREDYINGNVQERRAIVNNSVLTVFSERAFRSTLSKIWTLCMSLNLPGLIRYHLLSNMGVALMPILTNPLSVADFLTDSFNRGGLVAVLALHGLFVLMIDHGLEYPVFYDQLYSLITPDAFSSRHRYQLFQLVDVCLKSIRVGSDTVAAFLKRITRVALLSPTPTQYFALPFIRQLLQRHSSCLALIHRRAAELESSAITEDEKKNLMALFEGQDPYDPVADLENCHAMESSLWELTLLEKHYAPAVSLMVSALASAAYDDTPLRFVKTYGRMFTAEATKDFAMGNLNHKKPEKLIEGVGLATIEM